VPRPFSTPSGTGSTLDFGDLPECVDEAKGRLGDWLEAPAEDPQVAGLQVFRCRLMFLLVIPGRFESEFQGLDDSQGGP
jgi:hypothetical protein